MTKEQMIAVLDLYTDKTLSPAIVEAHEMAIKELNVLSQLKKLLVAYYGKLGELDTAIDEYACRHCPHRVKGGCPVAEGSDCLLIPEECLELFLRYGLEEETSEA